MPVWQALREELKDQNFEVVTVASDSRGPDASRPFIEAAEPTHPTLLDPQHLVSELYNTRNVPAVFWLDESGRIVRGNDPIYATRRNRETGEMTVNERYLVAVRSWVRDGDASIYLTDADETRRRMGESDPGTAQAGGACKLGPFRGGAGDPAGGGSDEEAMGQAMDDVGVEHDGRRDKGDPRTQPCEAGPERLYE